MLGQHEAQGQGGGECAVLGAVDGTETETCGRAEVVDSGARFGFAATLVQSDVRAAEFKATSTNKPAARDTLALRSAQATESEEASGAGLVNFGILVTATVIDPVKARAGSIGL